LVAHGHVGVLIGDFQQAFANSATLSFAQLREFLDNFRCAHGQTIALVGDLSGESLLETFTMRSVKRPSLLLALGHGAYEHQEEAGRHGGKED